jgi:hypothetical protein
VWPLEEPAILAPFRALDRVAWGLGAPHLLSTPLTTMLDAGIGSTSRMAWDLGGGALVGALMGGLRALRGRPG